MCNYSVIGSQYIVNAPASQSLLENTPKQIGLLSLRSHKKKQTNRKVSIPIVSISVSNTAICGKEKFKEGEYLCKAVHMV